MYVVECESLLLSLCVQSTIHEQIIEDIMGLEEKFGDTLGLPYLEPTVMVPQTVSAELGFFLYHNYAVGI